MLTTRFGKLHDILGAKIFPLILDILCENDISMRDRLNKLEKIGIIDDASWWMELREIRNQLTHDYPDSYDLLATHFNRMMPYISRLMIAWQNIKNYAKSL